MEQLARDIVAYMAEYDRSTLLLDSDGGDFTTAVIDAYVTTLAQLGEKNNGWTHVAWYLITQLAPSRDEIAECEAYDILERLFAYHGIG